MDLKEQKAQYDSQAKKILSQKKILAYILKRTVPEFQSASLDDIATRYIEGEPLVSTVPVDEDETNPALLSLRKQDTAKIKGSRNESASATEGKVIYDLLFQAKAPGTGEPITLIINIEAQKDIHPKAKKGDTYVEYPLLTRAVYYVSRLLSSQKGSIFTGSDYGSIRKVYSIWICMKGPEGKSAINRYQLKEQHLLHRYKEPVKNYDLAGIVFVYLGSEQVRDKMMRMLQLIFKDPLPSREKEKRLSKEYDININEAGKEALDTMCNLSEGIYEDGIAQGIEKGHLEGQEMEKKQTILGMLKEKLPLDMISRVTKASVEQITELGKLNGLL